MGKPVKLINGGWTQTLASRFSHLVQSLRVSIACPPLFLPVHGGPQKSESNTNNATCTRKASELRIVRSCLEWTEKQSAQSQSVAEIYR